MVRDYVPNKSDRLQREYTQLVDEPVHGLKSLVKRSLRTPVLLAHPSR